MKVVRLQSNNILRLSAVDITPSGNLVVIGGRNGAGKSSVLNSIAMALGGLKLCPTEPIKAGESEGKIVVDLDDLTITRKFYREPILKDVDKAATAENFLKWGETNSTLVVTNKDGAHYPSPQAMLDKLLGKLTFDPLAFAHEDDRKKQAEILRKVVGLDTSIVDENRKQAAAARAMAKKTYEIKAAQFLPLVKHEGVPDVEISMDEISSEMLKAEELRKVAEEAERKVSKATDAVASVDAVLKNIYDKIAALEEQIIALKQGQATATSQSEKFVAELSAAKAAATEARAAVPDVNVIREKLATTQDINVKVRANAVRAAREAELFAVDTEVQKFQAAVEEADIEKDSMLSAVTFPVEGLGLSDDGVTFNDLPFSQAGSAEQLRVSVAIGLALNPKLKVLLIRNGNLLDDDSLQAVAEQAEKADAQVWMEFVTSDSEGVQVMIEDGHVAAEAV